MARRTKEEAQVTRQRILDAALDVFSSKGYTRTTYDDIARRIRLTKGAVYWHFANKGELLLAMIQQAHERDTQVLGVLPEQPTWSELKAYFMARAQHVVSDPGSRKFFFFMCFQMEWSSELLQSLRERLRAEQGNPFAQIERAVSRLAAEGRLKPDVAAVEATALFWAVWFGLAKCTIAANLNVDLPKVVGRGFDAVAASVLLDEQEGTGL